MSLNTKNAAALIPAAAALAVSVAMMPSTPAVLTAAELRPAHAPVEVRTPRGRR